MTNATARLFDSTSVNTLNAEIDNLIDRLLADDRITCPECGGLCLDPFVDVNTCRIPRKDARARDLVDRFLDRQDTVLLPTTQSRIVCPSPAVARQIAALLRALGAPARAIYVGGF